jgi:hypothetical protein
MRHLVNYFRQVFCKHDWHIEEEYVKENSFTSLNEKAGVKVYMRCKKCGYHKNHWKFF